MVTSFMIGNDLLFDTSEMVLHHLKDGESIHLSGVKGRCLKCLISHTQQDITTKSKFAMRYGDNLVYSPAIVRYCRRFMPCGGICGI